MATNSDLQYLYGIHGFDIIRTQYPGGTTHLHLQHAKRSIRCPDCLSARVIKNGTGSRTLRLTPTGNRPAFVVLQTQRIRCCRCPFRGWLPVPFADPRRTYTRAFERYALELLDFGTIDHVAKHLGVGWDLVKDIHKRHLHKRYDKPPLKNVRRIAIDEFYAGKKTKYFTFVLDLDSGTIIHVGRGKKAEALDKFWKRLRRHRDNIQAVAMDMSGAFQSAVTKNLPKAVIVFDPFHVVKLVNEKLDQIRRDLVREAAETDKEYIKGTRWLLLKGAQNLSHKPNPKKGNRSEVELLEEALAFNQPLATAYYLKEDLRRLWSHSTLESGGEFLDGWIVRAEATGIGPLGTMAQTLRRHRAGVLAYFTQGITSGPMEAMNNKIRVFQRQTYGLRDHDYWELCIKSIHRRTTRLVVG